ncbi:MAG TPA: amidohydrolase family protein, partial [Synergistales bacterium]|nr:amidohydrolase family protein [Synergistales bacterium]
MAVLFRDFIYMDAEMERASRGDILVEGDRIAAIGPGPGELAGEIETVQGKGRTLLIPGLVNGHTHAAMVLLRGLGEELPLKQWLEERIWPVEAGLVPEHIYWGTRGAIMEMVSTGTTCFSD